MTKINTCLYHEHFISRNNFLNLFKVNEILQAPTFSIFGHIWKKVDWNIIVYVAGCLT